MKPRLHIHHFDPQASLHTWFACLQHQPWAILLESAGPLGADNGFDIISADPLATLKPGVPAPASPRITTSTIMTAIPSPCSPRPSKPCLGAR
jgi:hypothetical protein